MNKIGRVFVVYIFIIAVTGAVEAPSKLQSSSRIEPNYRLKDQSKKITTVNTAPKQTLPPITKAEDVSSFSSKPNHVSAHAVFNNGMVGVASFSSGDSRNGRYSVSGFNIYPDPSAVKTDKKGTFYFKADDGKSSKPLTITKQGDGVTGTIRIQPGSVSVSSSSKAGGSSSASASSGSKIPDFEWPLMMNDIFFPTFPAFPTIQDPYAMRSSSPYSFPNIPEPIFPRISEPNFARVVKPWAEKTLYKQTYPRHDALRPTWFYPTFNPYMNFWR